MTVEEDLQTFISANELKAILAAKHKFELAVLVAEKKALEARLADAEYKNVVQQIFLANKLPMSATVDDVTGLVTLQKSVVMEEKLNEEDIEYEEPTVHPEAK